MNSEKEWVQFRRKTGKLQYRSRDEWRGIWREWRWVPAVPFGKDHPRGTPSTRSQHG